MSKTYMLELTYLVSPLRLKGCYWNLSLPSKMHFHDHEAAERQPWPLNLEENEDDGNTPPLVVGLRDRISYFTWYVSSSSPRLNLAPTEN